MNRKSLLSMVIVSLLLLSQPGCAGAIVGHWRLAKATPNKQALAVDNATFARDGTYTASVTIEGKTVEEAGRYQYNGFKLTMLPNGGGEHRYNTMIQGSSMDIIDGERKVILKKGPKGKN
jgi:hypothetical protein